MTFSLNSSAPLSNGNRAHPILPSKKKTLKSRLRQGHKLYGIFLKSANATIAEIAALAGYDFIIVDLEHGQGNLSDALHCMRAMEAAGSSCIIRIPENSHACVKKVLDLGPEGIMFSKIETVKDATDAVSFCRYQPQGVRGCAYNLVRDSRYGFKKNYLDEYCDDLLIMCQVETYKGITNIKDILAVDGVDCISTGPKDLSASIGLLHDPKNYKLKELLTKLEKTVLQSDPANGGAFLAGIVNDHHVAVDLKKRGYDIIIGASDISLFAKVVLDDIKAFKIGSSL